MHARCIIASPMANFLCQCAFRLVEHVRYALVENCDKNTSARYNCGVKCENNVLIKLNNINIKSSFSVKIPY